MSPRSLEQIRAADAAARAEDVRARPADGFKAEYLSYVNRLGPTILMNGLGQALAMELGASRGDNGNPHQVLYDNIGRWLCREGGVYDCAGGGSLVNALIEGTQDQYLRAQSEALAWLQWHKNFCRAVLTVAGGKETRAEGA